MLRRGHSRRFDIGIFYRRSRSHTSNRRTAASIMSTEKTCWDGWTAPRYHIGYISEPQNAIPNQRPSTLLLIAEHTISTHYSLTSSGSTKSRLPDSGELWYLDKPIFITPVLYASRYSGARVADQVWSRPSDATQDIGIRAFRSETGFCRYVVWISAVAARGRVCRAR
ncbi:hypothetical protein BCR34DRAFT_578415 [Clohesyomyces aquaticus]|uniref:Uncharacterized protein n=1 Tax=Clohesyomyces aquaticus TaxID=1231657 RepID=A0A1Y1YFI2_9PLEO|nr:hypothetical protein BCR34DRAFT_578415 [Clohesyomyces aquaticus]